MDQYPHTCSRPNEEISFVKNFSLLLCTMPSEPLTTHLNTLFHSEFMALGFREDFLFRFFCFIFRFSIRPSVEVSCLINSILILLSNTIMKIKYPGTHLEAQSQTLLVIYMCLHTLSPDCPLLSLGVNPSLDLGTIIPLLSFLPVWSHTCVISFPCLVEVWVLGFFLKI